MLRKHANIPLLLYFFIILHIDIYYKRQRMILQVLLFLAGLALIIFGADLLVEGASGIARKLGISEFVIGLTIVGFGTSAPELVVSLIGALNGNADIAIGNVTGSNILNVMLGLGLTTAILPIGLTERNRKRDIPVHLAVTLTVVLLGMKHSVFGIGSDTLGRADGLVLLALFAIYMYSCFKFDNHESEGAHGKPVRTWAAVAMILAGFVGLICGGELFVGSAAKIAAMLGISDKVIAVTILAGGTSMPEVVTCIVAAAKKRGMLALGNILGSNIFNLLLILGLSSVVNPLSFAGMDYIDIGMLVFSAAALVIFSWTGTRKRIDRGEGIILALCWTAYIIHLITTP